MKQGIKLTVVRMHHDSVNIDLLLIARVNTLLKLTGNNLENKKTLQ
jgi:hypothetical protein